MSGSGDRLAWFAAALAVVIWAFLPRPLWAFPVKFPAAPSVTVSDLPSDGHTAPVDTNDVAQADPGG